MILQEHKVEVHASPEQGHVLLRNDTASIVLPAHQLRSTILAVLAFLSQTDPLALEDAEDRIMQMPPQL